MVYAIFEYNRFFKKAPSELLQMREINVSIEAHIATLALRRSKRNEV